MRNLERRSVVMQGLVLTAAVVACGGESPQPQSDERPVRVLASGAQFRGTNGLLFGPDGKLYIASVVTPVIAVMDPETGAIEERLSLEHGVKGPDDLAFGPDGSLYWTDILIGEVGRRRPDGTTEVVADLGPGPNPITFSDDGRLFVSQCFFDDRLWEIDPEGVDEPRLINGELGPGCGLNGMDWGPDDYLYGPRWFRGEVARVDVDTGEVAAAATGFGVPAAVKFDSQGRLHVLDTLAGEIVRVVDGTKDVVGRVQPSSADNLAFSDDDRLFVSSFADGYVVEVLDPENNRTLSAGGINMPGGLALDSSDGTERLWLADFFALRALDPSSGSELDAERDVLGVSELGSVMTVHPHEDALILTTWFDNEVKVWNPAERTMTGRFGGFLAPLDALTYADGIAVAELGTGSVLHFDLESPDDRSTIAEDLGAPPVWPPPTAISSSPTAPAAECCRSPRLTTLSNRRASSPAVSRVPRASTSDRTADCTSSKPRPRGSPPSSRPAAQRPCSPTDWRSRSPRRAPSPNR